MANIGYPKKRPRTPLALSGVRGLLFAVSSMKKAGFRGWGWDAGD